MNILREARARTRWAYHRFRNRMQGRSLDDVPSSYRAVAFIPSFNEADIIEPLLARLAASGLQAYVIDNWSSDGTWELANKNAAGNILGLERYPEQAPTADYDLQSLAARIEALSAKIRADWSLWNDADEYLQSPWPGISMRSALFRVELEGFNAVSFQRANFHPVDDNFAGGSDFVTHFRHWIADQSPLAWNRAWKGTADGVRLPEGSHDPRFPGRHRYPQKFFLRHYPIRSQAHGERKIFRERRPRYSRAGRSRGWHVQYNQYSEGDSFLMNPEKLHLLDEATFPSEMKWHQRNRCPICSRSSK